MGPFTCVHKFYLRFNRNFGFLLWFDMFNILNGLMNSTRNESRISRTHCCAPTLQAAEKESQNCSRKCAQNDSSQPKSSFQVRRLDTAWCEVRQDLNQQTNQPAVQTLVPISSWRHLVITKITERDFKSVVINLGVYWISNQITSNHQILWFPIFLEVPPSHHPFPWDFHGIFHRIFHFHWIVHWILPLDHPFPWEFPLQTNHFGAQMGPGRASHWADPLSHSARLAQTSAGCRQLQRPFQI